MKYLKALAVVFVILSVDFLSNGFDRININYLFGVVSMSCILTLGTWFLQNLVISNIIEMKKEATKITFYIDLVLILFSSIYLFFTDSYLLFIAWILAIALSLPAGIHLHYSLWKQNRE